MTVHLVYAAIDRAAIALLLLLAPGVARRRPIPRKFGRFPENGQHLRESVKTAWRVEQ